MDKINFGDDSDISYKGKNLYSIFAESYTYMLNASANLHVNSIINISKTSNYTKRDKSEVLHLYFSLIYLWQNNSCIY